MLDGKLTSIDAGKVSLIIHNEDKASKRLFIHGLDNESNTNLFFSKITDETKNIYDISFCNENLASTPKLIFIKNATNPYRGKICLPDHINPGIYQGILFIQGKNNTSIPNTIATEPKLYVAITWILIGILISIIIWELIHYIDKHKEAEEEADNLIAPRADLTTIGKNKFHGILQTKRLDTYITHRFKSSTAPKVGIVDIGTVVFGIAVGFFTSLNQTAVMGIRVSMPSDVLFLIGTGLAIGSFRELFTRPKSTD